MKKEVKHINTGGQFSESWEQKTLFRWWNVYRSGNCPGALMFAIPNGGARDAVTGSRMKAEGVLAGVPDVFLAWPSKGRHGLFLELKRAKGGNVSEAQKIITVILRDAGYGVAVCHGWEAARSVILQYLEDDETGGGDGRPSVD